MDFHHFYRVAAVQDLEAFVADGQEEHLHLDFKLVKGASFRSDDDKRNLAKALSGFSNSSGGVIVWGVDARKGSDGIDRAQALVPIDPVAQLVSRLNELTGSFVEPLVDGIQHRVIVSSGTAGFVLTMVPESSSGPHMAKAGEDRYYKRSGDSFYRMEQFDIADMFGRRQRPDLLLEWTLRSDGSTSSGGVTRDRVRVLFPVVNGGRGSASAPYVAFKLESPHTMDRYGIDGNGTEGLPRLPSVAQRQIAYGATASIVIHPGTRHHVCAIRVDVVRGGQDPDDIVLEYSLAAEGERLKSEAMRIEGAKIAALVREGIPSTGS